MLTNGVVSFEQPGSGGVITKLLKVAKPNFLFGYLQEFCTRSFFKWVNCKIVSLFFLENFIR